MPDRLNVPGRSLFTGDNLGILRCLNSDSVDFIYVDPPRNTGKLLRAPAGSRARGFRDARRISRRETRPAQRAGGTLLRQRCVSTPRERQFSLRGRFIRQCLCASARPFGLRCAYPDESCGCA